MIDPWLGGGVLTTSPRACVAAMLPWRAESLSTLARQVMLWGAPAKDFQRAAAK